MPGIKGVVGAFFAFGKAADAFVLAQGVKPLPPSCYQFVRI